MAMVKGIDVATPAANAEMSKKIETSSESRDLGSEDNSESLVREDFDEISRARTIRNKYATLRYLGKIEQRLEELAGVETQGIDRIPDDKRRPPSLANAFFMWFSFNGSIASLPIGVLGPEFGLSLQLSVAAIIIGVFLGTFLSAYCALLGPKLGLRAIATSRYSFGFWGAKLCAIINILINVGFAVVNFVVAGQLLSAVSDYKMTIDVGCVIIALITYLVSLFGFGVIHTFEKYSWILASILEFVLVGQAAPHMNVNTPSQWSGLALAAAFLTYLAISFSYAAAWASCAADYYCNYRSTTPRWKIFTVTYAGLSVSTSVTLVLGACIGNAIFNYTPWTTTYDLHGLGGAIGDISHPNGWSKFVLVMSTFTVIGAAVACNYSSGLCAQLIGDHFHAVPRLVWSFLAMLAAMVLSIAGQAHLSALISDFCGLLGYWAICFSVVLFIEDQWFRRRDGYNLEAWDTASLLPLGLAAVSSLAISYCVGGVLGMDQTWFVGPIARSFGGIGGDVGIYLCFVISIVTYWPLRTIEKRYVKR